MKLTYLTSASVIIEDQNVKILCDPWLVDGEFYGSWANYPPLSFSPEEFNNVDYIYISHIHPDHCSIKTLNKMNKDIPILIHNYGSKFLKNNIERLGYKVIEIDHNKRTHLKNNLHINILAADNCNPELCHKYFGCSIVEKNFGSTSIDTMSVVDNGQQVIVNTNDCPFSLAETSATVIKKKYTGIDMLLVGYSSASAYPQCFTISESDKIKAKNKIVHDYWSYAESYVNLLKPKVFLPFAGRYTLAGKKSILNSQRAVLELEDAYEYFTQHSKINQKENKCIILNSKSSFDLDTKQTSEVYTPIDKNEKQNYIDNTLSKRKYDFEYDDKPEIKEILALIPSCFDRYEKRRIELGFSSEMVIIIEITKEKFLLISANGNGYKIIKKNELNQFTKYVKISLDNRLLMRILSGPKNAHWNNAEIGSHLTFERNPNHYERGLYYCLSYFHT
jgi:UDP-MurNAc hydroxylase